MLISSIAEIVSIGAVIPFLALLMTPETLRESDFLTGVLKIFGVVDPDDIQFAIAALFSLVAILSMVIRSALLWLNIKFAHAVGSEISCEVFRRALNQPYICHISQNSSEIIGAAINKVSATVNLIGQSLTFVTSLVFLVLVTLIVFLAEPVAATATVGLLSLIYMLIASGTRQRLRINGQNIAQEQVKAIKTLQEGLGGIRDVILDSKEDLYFNIYRQSDRRWRSAQGSSDFIGMSPRFVLETGGIVFIAAFAYSLSRVDGGLLAAIPFLGALALGAQRVLPAFQQMFGAWSTIKSLQPQVQDIIEFFGRSPATTSPPSKIVAVDLKKSIELSNVSFRYSKSDRPALKSVSIAIPKGKKVALVGNTGSGKSTLVDVIMGLIEPTEGSVLIDGVSLNSVGRKNWQRTIAHVPQSIYLVDGTIAENIALGTPSQFIDMERVRTAAAAAKLADFIDFRSDGLEALVGERGVRLSGGQRQRIGIARAFYKHASVLIFDEATSALDNMTERAVIDTIDRLDNSVTVILIAHRLTSVKRCDTIIELRDGSVVGLGDYRSLLKSSETFRRAAELNDLG
jgi:ABC-type multidrug transport system fused ATPase/permease subunit